MVNIKFWMGGRFPLLARILMYLLQDNSAYRVERRRRIHENDVRSLAVSSNSGAVYSGGAEYFICICSRSLQTDALKNVCVFLKR